MNNLLSRRILGAVLALVTAGIIAPAIAHHGWNGNGEEQFELTGTVETVLSLNGPHATMKIRAAGQLGTLRLHRPQGPSAPASRKAPSR